MKNGQSMLKLAHLEWGTKPREIELEKKQKTGDRCELQIPYTKTISYICKKVANRRSANQPLKLLIITTNAFLFQIGKYLGYNIALHTFRSRVYQWYALLKNVLPQWSSHNNLLWKLKYTVHYSFGNKSFKEVVPVEGVASREGEFCKFSVLFSPVGVFSTAESSAEKDILFIVLSRFFWSSCDTHV